MLCTRIKTGAGREGGRFPFHISRTSSRCAAARAGWKRLCWLTRRIFPLMPKPLSQVGLLLKWQVLSSSLTSAFLAPVDIPPHAPMPSTEAAPLTDPTDTRRPSLPPLLQLSSALPSSNLSTHSLLHPPSSTNARAPNTQLPPHALHSIPSLELPNRGLNMLDSPMSTASAQPEPRMTTELKAACIMGKRGRDHAEDSNVEIKKRAKFGPNVFQKSGEEESCLAVNSNSMEQAEERSTNRVFSDPQGTQKAARSLTQSATSVPGGSSAKLLVCSARTDLLNVEGLIAL